MIDFSRIIFKKGFKVFTIHSFIVIIDIKIGGDYMKKVLILLVMLISFTSTVKADSDLSFAISAPSEVSTNGKASIVISISSFNNTKGDIKTCNFKMTTTNELTNQKITSALENWTITSSDAETITISTSSSPISSLTETTKLINISANISDTTQITISNITCYGDSNQDDLYTANDISATISKKQYNTNLKELSTSPVNISPTFTNNNLRYNIELGNNQNSLTIVAIPEDSNATVKIMANGEDQDTTLTINSKETIISIIVENNGETKTYTLNVTKDDSSDDPSTTINTELSKLEINGTNIELKTNVRQYTVTVGNNISSTRIVAQLKDSNAKFKDNYGPRDVQLNVGTNTFEIVVIGDENTETTYKITINRSVPASSSIPPSSTPSSSSNPNTAGPLSITFIVLFMVASLYASIIYYKKYNNI